MDGVRRSQTVLLGNRTSSWAEFSECGKYRYALWRDWGDLFTERSYVMFVGLNPSTANEWENDRTLTRCIDYATKLGATAMCMTNLFAYVATEPKVMKAQQDPIGMHNDRFLREVASGASVIIAAWGNHGGHMDRDLAVQSILGEMRCLSVTKDGYPGHPLYLKKDLEPQTFAGRVVATMATALSA